MARAVILGGTGAVGRATARRLRAAGWEVVATGRDPEAFPASLEREGVRFVRSDRWEARDVNAALGGGADLLVDCACFSAEHARLLLPYLADVGSTVMLSSKAVYVDARRNHPNSDVAPCFDGPIRETQPTVEPNDEHFGSREGYGAGKIAAERALLESDRPVTVLRLSKVHGDGAARPREWVFVKRILDRRRVVVLARHGTGVDHTTAAANVAALIETIAANPGARVLNAADPDAPSALEIARTIAGILGHEWREVLLDGPADGSLGAHPWDAEHPVVLDTTAAIALGYEPVGDYATTVTETVEWLVTAARTGVDAARLPRRDDPFFADFFDYAREDRLLTALRKSPQPAAPGTA